MHKTFLDSRARDWLPHPGSHPARPCNDSRRALALGGQGGVLPAASNKLLSARHGRHVPEHAVAPLPPPLTVVVGAQVRMTQLDRTHRYFRRSRPGNRPKSAGRACGRLWGAEGGKGSLPPPASLTGDDPSRTMTLRRL